MPARSRNGSAASVRAAREAGGQGAFGFSASASAAPVVPGVGNPITSAYKLPQDDKAQRTIQSRAALYGRVSTRLGPYGSNISSHPLRGITPARVSSILGTVYTTGLMASWADLCEDVYRYDSEIKTLHQSGTEMVTGAPFTIEPADASDEARAIADYQQSVIDNLTDFDGMSGRLLLGNLQGYSLEEVVYEERTVRFPLRGSLVSVTGPTPVSSDYVHVKHTRWDLSAGDTLELDTSRGFIAPPTWKFPLYTAPEPYAVRNRGAMTAAVWLSIIKSGAWARWGVTLDTWGLRSVYGFADQALWQDPVRRAEMLAALRDVGLGLPALFTDDFRIEPSPSVADGETHGMFASIVSAIDLELSKLIIGSTLTTGINGTGSYNASETHADTKELRVRGWARNLAGRLRTWLRAALKLVVYEINPDGTYGDVSRTGLCAALGIPPERVLALCGRPAWRIQREQTTADRMALYVSAVNDLGLEVDADAAYREFGLPRARHSSKRIPGKPVTLSGDAAATSTSDAVDGAENPKPDPTPTPKPPTPTGKARPPRHRASDGRFARKAA